MSESKNPFPTTSEKGVPSQKIRIIAISAAISTLFPDLPLFRKEGKEIPEKARTVLCTEPWKRKKSTPKKQGTSQKEKGKEIQQKEPGKGDQGFPQI